MSGSTQQQQIIVNSNTSNNNATSGIADSSVVQSTLSTASPRQQPTTGGIQGIVCNDSTGLCLASKGEPMDTTNSGIYTSLVRLANQLEGNHTSVDPREPISSPPLITVETESTNILVKEYYDGHTIAMKVPSRSRGAGNSSVVGAGTEGGTGASTTESNNSDQAGT